MPVIRIRYKGRIYIRKVIANFMGNYIMVSKGKEYWFKKDKEALFLHNGWRLTSGGVLPIDFFEQIVEQLEEFYMRGK